MVPAKVRCSSKSAFVLEIDGKNEDILPGKIYVVDTKDPAVIRRMDRGDLIIVSLRVEFPKKSKKKTGKESIDD